MLTLEKELVENAKVLGLNLSQISEQAIEKRVEERLRPRGGKLVQIPKTQKITLKNIGPFRDEKVIEFSPGINIIVGPSGSGKTTVLNSLRSAYSDYLPPAKHIDASKNEESYVKVEPEKGRIKKGGGVTLEKGVDIERDNSKADSSGLKLSSRTGFDSIDEIGDKIERYLEMFDERSEGVPSAGNKAFREILFQFIKTRSTECYIKDDALSLLDQKAREIMMDIFVEEKEKQVIITDVESFPDRDSVKVIKIE